MREAPVSPNGNGNRKRKHNHNHPRPFLFRGISSPTRLPFFLALVPDELCSGSPPPSTGADPDESPHIDQSPPVGFCQIRPALAVCKLLVGHCRPRAPITLLTTCRTINIITLEILRSHPLLTTTGIPFIWPLFDLEGPPRPLALSPLHSTPLRSPSDLQQTPSSSAAVNVPNQSQCLPQSGMSLDAQTFIY